MRAPTTSKWLILRRKRLNFPSCVLEHRSPGCAAKHKNGVHNKHGCDPRANGRFSIGGGRRESEPQQGDYPDAEDVQTRGNRIDELIALRVHEEGWVCGHGISEINGVRIRASQHTHGEQYG